MIRKSIKRLLPTLFFIILFAGPVRAQAELPSLFRPAAQQARQAGEQSPEIVRWRKVEVDFGLLQHTALKAALHQPNFVFNFFEDAHYQAIVEEIVPMANGAVGVTGRVDSPEVNEFVLVLHGELVQAYLQDGGRFFEIRYDGRGHLVAEVDAGQFPEPLEPELFDPDVWPQLVPEEVGTPPQPQADPAGQIDVLAVYTPAARAAVGGQAAMEAKIQASILSSNQGYTASGVSQQVRLVGMEEVAYTESVPGVSDPYQTWSYALYRLTFGYYPNKEPADSNYLAEARSFREAYGADLVFMVTALPSTFCGLGWLGGDASEAYLGYSVVHYNCTGTSSFSVQHEMGHNMGACHDRANNSSTGCYDMNYSYGFQQTNQFYTVMSYSNGCGSCSRLNRWSNPNQTYNGFPIGVALSQSNAAFNTLTLNNTAANVANYRQSVSPITASFISPTSGGTLMIPRTYLDLAAASQDGSIVRVTYSAFYDGTWHTLVSDSNPADGWLYLWPTYNISPQTIALRAEIEDSQGNVEVFSVQGVALGDTQLVAGEYNSRQGGGGLDDNQAEGTAPDQPGWPGESSLPAAVPERQVPRHPFLNKQRLMLY